MRTTDSGESFSYYITSKYELDRLKQLQAGIKTGKIDFLDTNGRKSQYIFAIDVSKKIIDWFYYSNAKELEKQLVVWTAFLYFFENEKREIMDHQIHDKLLAKSKKLIQSSFFKYFSFSISANGVYRLSKKELYSYDVKQAKYNELCMDVYGKLPVYPLDEPWRFPCRVDSIGVIGPRINFNYTFMYQRDWNRIILNNIPDKLNRAESRPTLIKDWKEVITKHEIHANHVYDVSNYSPRQEYKTEKEGFVYLLSNEFYLENLFKIGYTTRDVEDRVSELYTTGVPAKFNVEYKLSVNNIRKVEEAIHSELAKNRVNNEREFFLGNKDLFIKTIQRFEKLR